MGDIEEIFFSGCNKYVGWIPPDQTVTGPASHGGGSAEDTPSSMFVSAGQVEEKPPRLRPQHEATIANLSIVT